VKGTSTATKFTRVWGTRHDMMGRGGGSQHIPPMRARAPRVSELQRLHFCVCSVLFRLKRRRVAHKSNSNMPLATNPSRNAAPSQPNRGIREGNLNQSLPAFTFWGFAVVPMDSSGSATDKTRHNGLLFVMLMSPLVVWGVFGIGAWVLRIGVSIQGG
jgi:hypothetical protein